MTKGTFSAIKEHAFFDTKATTLPFPQFGPTDRTHRIPPTFDIKFTPADDTETAIQRACAELAQILIAKRRDYGRGNIGKRGIDGILVRIDDKITRIENLSNKANIVENEPIADSWRDLAGYAIIGKLFTEGKW